MSYEPETSAHTITSFVFRRKEAGEGRKSIFKNAVTFSIADFRREISQMQERVSVLL